MKVILIINYQYFLISILNNFEDGVITIYENFKLKEGYLKCVYLKNFAAIMAIISNNDFKNNPILGISAFPGFCREMEPNHRTMKHIIEKIEENPAFIKCENEHKI